MASNLNPLTGQELQARYQQLRAEGISHRQAAIELGYYNVPETGKLAGKPRASVSKLNAALLKAQGVQVEDTTGSKCSGSDFSIVRDKGFATISNKALHQFGLTTGDTIHWTMQEGYLVGRIEKAGVTPQPVAVAA